jgi:hypothetical protein
MNVHTWLFTTCGNMQQCNTEELFRTSADHLEWMSPDAKMAAATPAAAASNME